MASRSTAWQRLGQEALHKLSSQYAYALQMEMGHMARRFVRGSLRAAMPRV